MFVLIKVVWKHHRMAWPDVFGASFPPLTSRTCSTQVLPPPSHWNHSCQGRQWPLSHWIRWSLLCSHLTWPISSIWRSWSFSPLRNPSLLGFQDTTHCWFSSTSPAAPLPPLLFFITLLTSRRWSTLGPDGRHLLFLLSLPWQLHPWFNDFTNNLFSDNSPICISSLDFPLNSRLLHPAAYSVSPCGYLKGIVNQRIPNWTLASVFPTLPTVFPISVNGITIYSIAQATFSFSLTLHPMQQWILLALPLKYKQNQTLLITSPATFMVQATINSSLDHYSNILAPMLAFSVFSTQQPGELSAVKIISPPLPQIS